MKQSRYIAFVSMICFIVACKKENQTPKVIDIPNIPLEKIEGTFLIRDFLNFRHESPQILCIYILEMYHSFILKAKFTYQLIQAFY